MGLRQGDPLSLFLFLLVVDVLSRLMDKGVSVGMVNGFKMGCDGVHTSCLQFANNTLFMLEASSENLANVRNILKFFSKSLGLKINMHKNTIGGINLDMDEVRTERDQVWSGCLAVEIFGFAIGWESFE